MIGRQVPIGTFATRADAEVAQGLLATAGIAASVSSDDAGGAYPFDFSGGAQLLVDQDDVAAASELLAGKQARRELGQKELAMAAPHQEIKRTDLQQHVNSSSPQGGDVK